MFDGSGRQDRESFLNQHRTKKKCSSFSRMSVTKAFATGHGKLRQRYIARRKAVSFSRTPEILAFVLLLQWGMRENPHSWKFHFITRKGLLKLLKILCEFFAFFFSSFSMLCSSESCFIQPAFFFGLWNNIRYRRWSSIRAYCDKS